LSAQIGTDFGISRSMRERKALLASLFSNGMGLSSVATGAIPVEKYK
jgi:hypothetical protein